MLNMKNQNQDKITACHLFSSIVSYLFFGIVNILQLIIQPIALVLTFLFDRDRQFLSYITKFFYWMFYYLNFVQRHRYSLNGLKAPKKGERRIYVLNHASSFDVILMSILPGPIKGLMKESYTKLPIVGWIAMLSGNVVLKEYMDSGEQIDFYMKMEEMLERGVPLVIFPEGTRSRDGKLANFYDGTFKLAIDTKSDIVPVVFDSWNIIRPGAFWIRDTTTVFKVLDTFKYDEFKNYSYKDLSKIMRTKFIENLLAVRDERRKKEKRYYRKIEKFEKIDNEMRDELKMLEEKYSNLLQKG